MHVLVRLGNPGYIQIWLGVLASDGPTSFLGRHLLNMDSKNFFTSSGVSFPDSVV